MYQRRIETSFTKQAAAVFKNLELFVDGRSVQHFGRCQVCGETLELQVWRGFEGCAERWQILCRRAQTSHAAVQLEMNRMLRNPNPSRSPFQQFDMPDLPNCRCKAEADDFFFLTAPKTGHQQNSSGDSFFAERDRFVE